MCLGIANILLDKKHDRKGYILLDSDDNSDNMAIQAYRPENNSPTVRPWRCLAFIQMVWFSHSMNELILDIGKINGYSSMENYVSEARLT